MDPESQKVIDDFKTELLSIEGYPLTMDNFPNLMLAVCHAFKSEKKQEDATLTWAKELANLSKNATLSTEEKVKAAQKIGMDYIEGVKVC